VNKKRVLFVCDHNSARSQMAEAFLKQLAGDRVKVASAGLDPGVLNPLVVQVMKEIGIDISRHTTASVFDLYKRGNLYSHVITVCDAAQAEKCPIFPGVSQRLHWSFQDPSQFQGTEEEKLNQTRLVRDEIKGKIEEWLTGLNEIPVIHPDLGQKPLSLRNTVRALIRRDTTVLLIKNVYPETGRIAYGLPGGAQAPGESLVEALRRECLEEIALSPAVGELIRVHEYERRSTSGLRHVVEFIFACFAGGAYVPQCGDKPDHHQTEVLWVPVSMAGSLLADSGVATDLLEGHGPLYRGKRESSGDTCS
jgi:arsenate reductase